MRKCFYCGTEIPDDEGFCCECGMEYVSAETDLKAARMDAEEVAAELVVEESASAASLISEKIDLEKVLDGTDTDEENAEHAAERPIGKKKIKWWYIGIPVALVVAAAVLLLGPFFIYLAPKAVLAKSFSETVQDLAARAEGTPITILEKADDGSQKTTITMDFDASHPLVKDIHLGMLAKIDRSTRQNHISVQTDILGRELDMNLYMDREVAAVNADQITGKDYYGIYYDTFGHDIRDNEYMYNTVGEENIAAVEEMTDLLNQMLNLEPLTPEQQNQSLQKYADVLLEFMNEKNVSVGKSPVSVDGKTTNCKTIAFSVSNQEYAELMLRMIDVAQNDPMMRYYYQSNTLDFTQEGWEKFLNEQREAFRAGKGADGVCEFTFYLHGGKVVQMDVEYEENADSWYIYANFGSDASVQDIELRVEFAEGEYQCEFEFTLSTEKKGDFVTETLHITTQEGEGDPTETDLGYKWNRQSGEMHISLENETEGSFEMDCVLTELENGYTLSFPELEQILGIGIGIKMSAEISVTAGAEIEVPEIKDVAKLTEMGLLGLAMKYMQYFDE